jgi:murein L,D-transpeptidase YcbB/YkuD
LPVLLLYLTTDIGPNGEYMFYKDIYARDQKILTALGEPFVLRDPRGI